MQACLNETNPKLSPKLRGLGMQLLVYALLIFSRAPLLSAAVFHVPAGDVSGLIMAINTANSNGEENTIILEAGIYTLLAIDNTITPNESNGLPVITSVLTLKGAGAGLTSIGRDANAPSFRIMFVAATATLTLDGLTIRGGVLQGGPFRGGGVANEGTVIVANSSITDNTVFSAPGGGGSLFNAGTMTVISSSIFGIASFGGSGGGVLNQGTLTITDSRVSGDGLNGAGIANSGNLVITNSSISGLALGDGSGGGGISNSRSGTLLITNSHIRGTADGGGGIINSGTLTLTNSTISGAAALFFGGGGILTSGRVTISNSTIAGNWDQEPLFPGGGELGGGILITSGTVTLQNSILARNGRDAPSDCSGALTSLGNNLIGDPTGCTISLQPSDRTGDAGLGTSVDPGAPGAGRVPLLSGSPAIDAGNDSACPSTDQLGTPRNGPCDIGAVEFYPVVNDLVALGNLTTVFDPTPVTGGPAGTFLITATFDNISNNTILFPFFEVATIRLQQGLPFSQDRPLLLNADGGPGREGARLTPEESFTMPFEPGATRTIEFRLGLQRQEPFTFFVNMLGEPRTSNSFVSKR